MYIKNLSDNIIDKLHNVNQLHHTTKHLSNAMKEIYDTIDSDISWCGFEAISCKFIKGCGKKICTEEWHFVDPNVIEEIMKEYHLSDIDIAYCEYCCSELNDYQVTKQVLEN